MSIVPVAAEWLSLYLVQAFWAAVVAVGYGVLFQAPPRLLLGCALTGAAGHLVRSTALHMDLGLEIASLLGATSVGFLGWRMAHWWRAPAYAFTVPGVIPLAPGVFAYQATLGLIRLAAAGNQVQGGEVLYLVSYNATKTVLILAALALGITAPTLLFRRRKPVV